MKKKARISTDTEPVQWVSPFAALKNLEPPSNTRPQQALPQTSTAPTAKPAHRGRIDIRRHTVHRGGKTVTVIAGFVGIGQAEKERLAKRIQRACGAGGTIKEGRIEIQGDQRETVARILTEAGFQPVLAGG